MGVAGVRMRPFGLIAAVGLAAACVSGLGLGLSGPAAAATTRTCPKVNSATGAVTPAPKPGVDWADCVLNDADLHDANLTGADLADSDLLRANLAGANLSQADLDGAGPGDANLAGADLAGASFTGAFLGGVKSGGVTGQPAALPVHWSVLGGYLIGPFADLSDANLAGFNLASQELGGIRFTGASLSGTILAGADLVGVASGGITGTPASLPANWALVGGYLIGQGADLADAQLAGADLSGLNLFEANVSLANLTGADLSGADLSQVTSISTELAGANLSGADLSSVFLDKTDLDQANLSTTTLADVQSLGLTGIPSSLPAGWQLTRGLLIGPGADLDFADLAGFDLAGADLTGTLLKSANLARANLTGAVTTGADFTSARWSDTTCPDGSDSDSYVDGCFSPLDRKAPSAKPAVSAGKRGRRGWHVSAVTVTWHWTDNGTIVTGKCEPSSRVTENGPVVVLATCTDRAGNTGHSSFVLHIDRTRPQVTVTGVHNGRRYRQGHVPRAGCRTTEAVSGVATRARLTVRAQGSHGLGKFTATCKGAVSVAGTSQSRPQRVTYTVVR